MKIRYEPLRQLTKQGIKLKILRLKAQCLAIRLSQLRALQNIFNKKCLYLCNLVA